MLLFVFGAGMPAAQRSGGSVDIEVRTRSAAESILAPGVYLALIAIDQPANRPAFESIVDGRVEWKGIAPGRYAVIAEAPSLAPEFRNIDVAESRNERVSIELQPLFELTGSVVDEKGGPVVGATVCHPRVMAPPLLGAMSAMARQNVFERSCATTEENGWWKLGVPSARASFLLVEASGYEPSWVTWHPTQSDLPSIALRRGSSLRVVTDRTSPELVLALVPSARIKTSVPSDWQDRVWAREVGATVVEWRSMPRGEYDLVATWPDPRRFATPVTLRRIVLGANAEEIKVALPDDPSLTTKHVRVRVPWKTAISNLRGFARTDKGAKEVRAASENAPGGRILYADGDARPEDIYFTTEGEVILGVTRRQTEENQEPVPAVEGVKFPKAEGKLRVSVPEGGTLPSHGEGSFDECMGDKSFKLPVNVQKGGAVALPLLVGCRALTLRFGNFSPVVVPLNAGVREEVWLGEHLLRAAASAQIHVIQEPSGTNVPEAIVTASVDRGPDDAMAFARQTAGSDGWLVMDGLPAGEEITFRAQEKTTNLAGVVARKLEPGQRAIIDPLALPAAASLTVRPRLADEFKGENPDAEIAFVRVHPDDLKQAESRSVELTRNEQEALFRGLNPGSWQIIALVRLGRQTQPIDVTTITLEPGDEKEIEAVIRPLFVTGHLLSRGRGVAASIEFVDPPGRGAINRRVHSKKDGSFYTLLPRPGVYSVAARREFEDPDTELGPIRLDYSSRNIRIELPEGSLSVKVLAGGAPAADVEVTASMHAEIRDERRLVRLQRRMRTSSLGEVLIDELQDGTWLVTARGKDGTVAEKTVAVSQERPAWVSLDLDGGSTLEGNVFDRAGKLAARAAVDCVYSGSDSIPRIVSAEADSWGKFSIRLPKPAPDRLQCGVTAADGAIGTFVTAPVSDARFALPTSTSALTIANWSDRGNRDRFWLLAPDGGLFDVSWAARKLRRLDSPFTIAHVPVGAWSVVRVDSPGAFHLLARGAAGSLPAIARFRIAPGEQREISMQSGDTSAPP